MIDSLTPAERSDLMSRIRNKHSKPEMQVRRLVHGMGYRYRLHRANLPGTPDLVFPARKKVIFMHGCFWHHHADPDCKLARMPKSNVEFWEPKLRRNRERDEVNEALLIELGWEVLVIWECELRRDNQDVLREQVNLFLDTAH